MNQQILDLARKGDVKAISALINRSLNPKGINAKVRIKDQCLQILLESEQSMNQQALVGFIEKGVNGLNLEAIKEIAIYARQTVGSEATWKQKVELQPRERTDTASKLDIDKKVEQPQKEKFETFKTDSKADHQKTLTGCITLIISLGFLWLLFIFYQNIPTPRSGGTNKEPVSSSTFQGEWMLTVDNGELVCEDHKVVIFIAPDGTKYAVNGTASGKGYPDINPIWKDDPKYPGVKVNIGSLIAEGLKLCD